MSGDDQLRWDRKHGEGGSAQAPSAFLREIIDGDPWSIAPGKALDVACGKGRNAKFLAARGFQVTAVDISSVALAQGQAQAKDSSLAIDWQQADLEQLQLPADKYALIVNINYLQRSLVRQIKQALRRGGHVVFETFMIDQQAFGHPSNPNHLLSHNELLAHFHDFRVLFYREGKFADGAASAFRAGILAQKIA
jgi:tellurite methyltransferase